MNKSDNLSAQLSNLSTYVVINMPKLSGLKAGVVFVPAKGANQNQPQATRAKSNKTTNKTAAHVCIQDILTSKDEKDYSVRVFDARPKCWPSMFPVCGVHHFRSLLKWGSISDYTLRSLLEKSGVKVPTHCYQAVSPSMDFYVNTGTVVHGVFQRAIAANRKWKDSLWYPSSEVSGLSEIREAIRESEKSTKKSANKPDVKSASTPTPLFDKGGVKEADKSNQARDIEQELALPAAYKEPPVSYHLAVDFSGDSIRCYALTTLDKFSRAKAKGHIIVSCSGSVDTVLRFEDHHVLIDYKTTSDSALSWHNKNGKSFPYHNNKVQVLVYAWMLNNQYGKLEKDPVNVQEISLVYVSRNKVDNFAAVPVEYNETIAKEARSILHRNMIQAAVGEYLYQNFVEDLKVIRSVNKAWSQYFVNKNHIDFLMSNKLCQDIDDHKDLFNPGGEAWHNCPLKDVCVGNKSNKTNQENLLEHLTENRPF